jgi:hypothetical protein
MLLYDDASARVMESDGEGARTVGKKRRLAGVADTFFCA